MDYFIDDLNQVASVRQQISECLAQMSETLAQSEVMGSLNSDIENINLASENLHRGVFRLLVLGDMKRGKSTFINALIGENVLPNAVNPCTAILTILRYGEQKQVTVYFKDERSPEQLEFKDFKEKYTIDPKENKKSDKQKPSVFTGVSHAIMEYPLSLLSKGLEIIDSPGLNDTEDRNELSLGYINNCHAVLFVMRASQPYTLAEHRYLENYIKGRGLTVFFIINGWDQIQEGILDPDDQEELQAAEMQLRQLFESNLSRYCEINGVNVYSQRVFEVSAINALRRKIKNKEASLEGTGFPEFWRSLNIFLTQDRAIAELQPALILAQQTYNNIQAAIQRRLSLLNEDVSERKQRINSVEPEFQELGMIRDQFQQEIITVRDIQAQTISESLRSYILNLSSTFEVDFLQYQPSLQFFDFLNKDKREAFNAALKEAFEQYTADKIAGWTLTVEQDMNAAFVQLSRSAAQYGATYSKVTHQIAKKLSGKELKLTSQTDDEEADSPTWTKWAMGLLSLSRGNIAGVAMAQVGFDWKNILLNYITAIGVNSVTTSITGVFLGPVGLALLGMGIGFLQADQARQKLVQTTQKELIKYLPQVAEAYLPRIRQGVAECFNTYEREVIEHINKDIADRKQELDNLLDEKMTHEINLQSESQRLQAVEAEIYQQLQQIEKISGVILQKTVTK
ncbi:dynamin family protein [Nodularia harveyana UHCC-0300]|uniref:Dynamin family protein n=1 Tax=Nodularia harveyana UHCC-0300 TaxID=2974287 RepID=A0A9E8AHF7_9CYAN|nr:dynamin family protein [Nodularia harveyana]MEA5582043.1 dynamin family protein [Nodularia harveyana UHCC-0300]UZC80148.1 ORF3 [Nodularia harveyana UHCC-0300]